MTFRRSLARTLLGAATAAALGLPTLLPPTAGAEVARRSEAPGAARGGNGELDTAVELLDAAAAARDEAVAALEKLDAQIADAKAALAAATAADAAAKAELTAARARRDEAKAAYEAALDRLQGIGVELFVGETATVDPGVAAAAGDDILEAEKVQVLSGAGLDHALELVDQAEKALVKAQVELLLDRRAANRAAADLKAAADTLAALQDQRDRDGGVADQAKLAIERYETLRTSFDQRNVPAVAGGIAATLQARQQGQQLTTPPVQLGWPLQHMRNGSSFGLRLHPIHKVWRLHAGVDTGAPTGTPIFAAEAGTVVISGGAGGYGTAVVIDHGGALATLYAHMILAAVNEGDVVTRGQVIGWVGSTGTSTAPHLHFEVRVLGQPVDPLPWFANPVS